MATLPKVSLKAEIPAELKSELEQQSKWGKVLSLTPVVMTVIATLLAGLSSSEMTRAQYDRSLAAQRQSKAGDQWNFFQGKKLRSAVQRSSLDLLSTTTEVHPLDLATLRQALAGTPAATTLDAPAAQRALAALRDGTPLNSDPAPVLPANVQATLAALDDAQPDTAVAKLLRRVTEAELDAALRASQAYALAFDVAQKSLGQTIDAWEKQLIQGAASVARRRDFTAARLDYAARRYDTEARMNQAIAALFELQVRSSNLSAERHHLRSGRFFYGMLAAQTGVIVATLALAAQRRNLLWGIAASAGMIALAFAVYVLAYV
jgi:hypothetical protein